MLKNLYLLLTACMLSFSLVLVGCPPSSTDDDDSAPDDDDDDDDATPPDDDDDDDDDDDNTSDDDDNTSDDDDFGFNQIQFSFTVTVLPPTAARDEARDDDDDSAAADDDDSATADDDDSATADDDDATTDDDDAGPDDDDATGDDDDSMPDDDDVMPDDDDATGDDDDATGDDDDATGDDDDAVDPTLYQTQAEFFFTYLEVDQAAGTGEVTCNQRISVEGTADFGFGTAEGCDNCTGMLSFDASTAVDISNPAKNPDDCDPLVLEAAGADMGLAMLTAFGDEPGHWTNADGPRNYGDFLSIATMDENTQQVLGYNGSSSGDQDLTAAGNADWAMTTYGADFTHVGLVNGDPASNTLAAGSGIETVSAPAGAGSDYYFYFVIAKDPAANPYEGSDMQGDYLGIARFVIGFQ